MKLYGSFGFVFFREQGRELSDFLHVVYYVPLHLGHPVVTQSVGFCVNSKQVDLDRDLIALDQVLVLASDVVKNFVLHQGLGSGSVFWV